MTALDGSYRDHADHREPLSSAVDALKAAYRDVRRDVTPGGWMLIDEPAVWAGDHFIVRFAMYCDGVVVSDCGFAVGPGRTVAFTRPAERMVTGAIDTIGEAEFRQLIVTWANEVRAGIGHRWRYEARKRDDVIDPPAGATPARAQPINDQAREIEAGLRAGAGFRRPTALGRRLGFSPPGARSHGGSRLSGPRGGSDVFELSDRLPGRSDDHVPPRHEVDAAGSVA